jgi:hypothetical protein
MVQQLRLDFSDDITLRNRRYSDTEITENKIMKKISKQRFKYARRISNNLDEIRALVDECPTGGTLDLMSKAFDSPNIVLTYLEEIKRLYVATWAITPAGIDALKEIADNSRCEECVVLLDKAHSYKWIFTSGAYKILKGKVLFKFVTSHSKFQCLELSDGTKLTFLGSMNFSNNPRWENIQVSKDSDDFDFYSEFVKKSYGGGGDCRFLN